LADKIVSYRKYRKRIFHIDELYRIGGISRKYFRRLVSVFYVPNQVVPGIGAQPPYSNALSTVSVQQKHQNTNANTILSANSCGISANASRCLADAQFISCILAAITLAKTVMTLLFVMLQPNLIFA
jgi:hypothetical protein